MADTVKSSSGTEALLEAFRRHPNVPGLGTAVARIVAMHDCTEESIQDLRNAILADVHLTQRILAIANSVNYRLSSGVGVSTVTRAIVVVGFEQVKLIALGMMFVDQIPDPERAASMKAELIQALNASLLARELSRQLAPEDKEKAGIAALLGNVGKLLLAMVDFDRFREIEKRVAKGASEASASYEVLGISIDAATNEVLTFWGIPDALAALSTSGGSATDSKPGHRLARIVYLAKTTAQHLRRPDGPERDALIAEIRGQCLSDSGVSGEVFDRWVAAADAQLAPIRALFKVAPVVATVADDGFPEGTVIDKPVPTIGIPNAVGKPANSRELVLSRLQDMTDLIAQRQSLSSTLLAALECLHIGFGYSRSLLLLRDVGTTRMRARVWCGEVTKEQAGQMQLDINARGDLFAAAIIRGSDLQIRNALDPKIAPRLPAYYSKACPRTASFILLPIVSEDSPIACILVCRNVPETDPINSEDISLLRAVRGQIVLAMKTVRS